MVIEAGSVVRLALPIAVHHSRFQLTYYDEHGERQLKIYKDELFPVDVFVAYNSDRQTVRVFLARSPHGGCLLNWRVETQKFEDPCYGSRFSVDGAYEFGPATRSLDELPAEVRDQMIWVRNEIVYGEGHQ
jgi:Rieske Fe-S protein